MTFENEMSQRRVEADYAQQDEYYCCCTPPALLFRGKYRIRVRQADDPTNIAWESIEINRCSRLGRSVVANTCLCVLLLATMVTVVLGTTYSRDILREAPDLTTCEVAVPTLLLSGDVLQSGWELTAVDPDVDPNCNRTGNPLLSIYVK